MGDRKPDALRRKGETTDSGLHFDRTRLDLARLDKGLLAGRPCDRTIGPGRDMVDPAALGVGRDQTAVTFGVGGKNLAVVAADRIPPP